MAIAIGDLAKIDMYQAGSKLFGIAAKDRIGMNNVTLPASSNVASKFISVMGFSSFSIFSNFGEIYNVIIQFVNELDHTVYYSTTLAVSLSASVWTSVNFGHGLDDTLVGIGLRGGAYNLIKIRIDNTTANATTGDAFVYLLQL